MYNVKKLILTIVLFICLCSSQQAIAKELPVYSLNPVIQDGRWPKEWWLPRHESKLEQAKEQAVELLMIGDSITHSWETKGKAVWLEYYQDKNALNLGFSSDRTEHVLWRLQHGAVENMKPKVAVLMIGTNNTGYRMDPAEHTAKGISAIVSELRKRLPSTKILLLAIFPRHHSQANEMRQRNDQINKLISTLDNSEMVYYLNINHLFVDDELFLKQALLPDLLHPNEQGYWLWAEAMAPILARMMK